MHPEWLAKQENNELSKVYLLNNYVYKQTYLMNHKTYIKHKYFCAEQPIDTCINNIDTHYLISKLQPGKWIKYEINNLLLNKYLKEFNDNFKFQNNKCLNKIYNNLCNLFSQIILTGIEWISLQQNTSEIKKKVNYINIFYIFNIYIIITTKYKISYLIQAKIINFLYHVGKLKFNNYTDNLIYELRNEILVNSDQILLKINQQAIVKLVYISISLQACKISLRYMKTFLYHKNKFKYFRFNSYLSYRKINSILNTRFKTVSSKYNNLILNQEFKYINSILNYIVRKWTKNKKFSLKIY